MSLSAKDLEMRMGRITATRIAQIALGNEHPYGGERAAYLDAVGESQTEQTALMGMGHFMEPGVLRAYSSRMGADKLYACPTVAHPKVGWAACSPDTLLETSDPFDTSNGLVEAKFISNGTREWGDDGSDTFPDHYRIQCHWQRMVTGRAWVDLAAVVRGELRVYRIEKDSELEGNLWQIGEKFWRDHINPRIAPPPDGSSASGSWIRKRFAESREEVVPATPEVEKAARRYAASRIVRDKAIQEMERAAQVIQEHMGHAAAMAVPNLGPVFWRRNKSGGVAWKDLAAEVLKHMPEERAELEAKFTRPGSRTLRVPSIEGDETRARTRLRPNRRHPRRRRRTPS